MEALEYVEIAKSRDEGRWNMTCVYRDVDRLIGTDGHRLHMVEGLPKIDKGHFLDGRDSEFPNYETALIKDPKYVCSVKFNAKSIRKLKALLNLFDRKINRGVVISCADGLFKVELSEPGVSAYVTFPCEEMREAFSVGVNLQYLIDALIPMETYAAEFHSDPKGMGVNIIYPCMRSTALIMAMRI